ncbi:MAG: hypothetical protein WEA24_11870 [Gemmatimonadota bacterium]
MTHPSRWIPLLLLAAACGNAPATSDAFVLRDSAGVRIAENLWQEDLPLETWRLADEPEFSVGDPAPGPEYELYRVYYARSFDDGRVVVAMNTGEVRIYDPQGSHLVSFGRAGEGPGEFTFLWDAHPVGDTLVRALDPSMRRLTFFDARTGALDEVHTTPVGFMNPNGVARLDDDSYVGLLSVLVDSLTRERHYRLARFSVDGQSVDTLDTFRADWWPDPTTRTVFGPGFSSTAAGGWMYGGWRGRYEVRRYGTDGALDLIIRSSFAGEPVTDEMKATVNQPAFSEGGGTAPPIAFPERLPPWSKILASPSGWLWVRRYASPLEEEFNTWDVFDPEGRLTGQIRTPMNARIAEIGDDWALGLFRNELDVESVRRYRVIREESG